MSFVKKELEQEATALRQQLAEIVETRELAVLQEVGIYDYSRPLQDAVAFIGALAELCRRIKVTAVAVASGAERTSAAPRLDMHA